MGIPNTSGEFDGQVVKQIANIKQQRIDQIYKLLKESAYDCEINKDHNVKMNKNLKCYNANVDIRYNIKSKEDIDQTIEELYDINKYNIFNKVEVPDTKCFAYILSTVDAIKISDIVYNKYDKHVKLNKSDKTAILDDIDKTVVGTWVTHSKSGFIVLISEYDFEENSILEKEDYICAEA